ncbi:MAG: hypothetical protein JWP63_5408, partial [Candidatus Solibacter sp.]|nr:hypothetical protein [Candidatus Solibacter sp.]
MGQSVNMSYSGGDDTSRRIIEEIAFHASMLALHAAIESASNGGGQIAGRITAQIDGQVD